MKKYIGFLLVLCLFIIPWVGQAQTQQEVLQQQVKNWAAKLSAKDNRFDQLQTADQRYHPLDSDSKQWLVTFSTGHQDRGYMVVGAEGRAFTLLEYGLGEYMLFDEQPVVPFPLESSARTTLYAGLQSVWVSKEGLYDAKSGEKYPSGTQVQSTSLSSFAKQDDKLIAISQRRPSDQTGAWIKPGETVKTEEDFINLMNSGNNLTFIGNLFDGTVLAPFTVRGFHQWEDELFVELEDDGSRFVPYQHAAALGTFFE